MNDKSNGMEDEEKNDELYKSFLDPKFPLLKKFRQIAPGTNKHCENVMSLCEGIALELGINENLLKVAARYHDIGKINYPEAFSENQNGENIHDNLDPQISYHIITKHVCDSVLYLLQIEMMPRKVLEIVSQHHGNTVLKFFHDKDGGNKEDMYRYKCQPPKSIEAVILMICDSVEATARALASNGKLNNTDDMKSVVDSTLKRLVDDDQLDDVRVKELKIIKKVLYRELENIYHKRILYEDDTDNKEDKKDEELEVI